MNELIELPEVFKGKWDHLLIVTYGADLPYFENVILRSDFRCPNKIILADGHKFLQSCESYEKDGRVRFLNQRYIAEGMYTSFSAHAKIILLTTRDKGKLLIGSGNLGQGYNSGGELFTTYEYSDKDDSMLAAFQSVWKFIDTLIEREIIGGTALHALQNLYAGTSWLMKAAKKSDNLVITNLNTGFIEQLQKTLNGESVKELWVMSPFFDSKCQAFEKLITSFRPRFVNLVIQPKYASLDPKALNQISKNLRKKITIYPFETICNGQSSYVHAKLILLKTATRAICLQGSPNCSKVAMVLPSTKGNIEVANLLVGKQNTFNDVFQHLDLQPSIENILALETSYHDIEVTSAPITQEWLLTSASWYRDTMTFYFKGKTPDIHGMRVIIGKLNFPIIQIHNNKKEVQIRLPEQAQRLLSENLLPILISSEDWKSSPIFPCNLDMLEREANTSSFAISTQDIQNFNPEDPEFENLLRELEASFPIARGSIWQLAGNSKTTQNNDSADDLILDYDKIDYELIRKHPKIQQYLHIAGKGTNGEGFTRLQQLMSAITAHFTELAEIAFRKKKDNIIIPNHEETDEGENEEIEQQPPHPRYKNRIKNLLKRFINRFLKGLESPDFVQFVGPEVIVNNYLIFSHVLWRLFRKSDWIDNDFIIESFFNMWIFFWGEDTKTGFVQTLPEEQKSWANVAIRNQKNDAMVLATLYHANWQCKLDGDYPFRTSLCQLWRHLLSSTSFKINDDILLDAWIYLHDLYPINKPSPNHMASELLELAEASIPSDSLDKIEQLLGISEYSFQIKTDVFFREHDERTSQSEYLEILTPINIKGVDDAKKILLAWMESGNRDYHRIQMPGYLIYYDQETQKGLYYDKTNHKQIEFEKLAVKPNDWEATARGLLDLAKLVEKKISFDISRLSRKLNGSEKIDYPVHK